MTSSWPLLAIRGASVGGIVACTYALYVEHQLEISKKTGEQYEAMCDIRAGGFSASCTAVRVCLEGMCQGVPDDTWQRHHAWAALRVDVCA
jgi:hypothetical protein